MLVRRKLLFGVCALVAALALVLQLPTLAGGRRAAAVQSAAAQSDKPAGGSVKSFIVQMTNGEATCRAATREETPLTIPSADNHGVPVTQLEPDGSARINAPVADGPGG